MGLVQRVAAVLCLAALGCRGGDAGPDAVCLQLGEGYTCDGKAPLDSRASCQGGRCLPGCKGDAARIPCSSQPGLGISCCTADQQCCPVGWETVGCRPAAVPCPRLCGPHLLGSWECPAETSCVYGYEYPESIPPDGTCPYLATEYGWNAGRCEADCPVERQCGRDCCGENARCQEADGMPCCVASRPDAGAGDASTGDAAGVGDGA